MGRSTWYPVAKGFALSVTYAILFIFLWRSSVSQWYLPAGIRMAGLLFLPRRLWPYLFLGDALALWWLRIPKAEQYSMQWAYLSPALLLPIVALLPRFVQRVAPAHWSTEALVPAIMAGTAVWTSVVNAGLNFFLDGPKQDVTLELFVRFAVGHYLGMLSIALPLLLWARKAPPDQQPHGLLRDSMLAGSFFAVSFLLTAALNEDVAKPGILSIMLLPPIALTFRHGWRGAAVGIAGAAIAIGFSLPDFDAVGAHDDSIFVAQEALAVLATAMFILGVSISKNFSRVAKLRVAELRAIQVARETQRLAEHDLRSCARALATSQMSIAWGYRGFVGSLKEKGQYELAMDATKQSVANTQMLLDQVSAIYPLGIETEGLYWTLRSSAFANACGTAIDYRLQGDASALSTDMSVLAYRCIVGAVNTLSGVDHHQIVVKTVTRSRSTRVLVKVQRYRPLGTDFDFDEEAWSSLQLRVQTNGGAVRRRHDHIVFVV